MVILIFVFTTLVYLLTSAGNTAYNHFTLLADAFLKGHLYITGIMPWLEKIPVDATKFYVANPPMPAVLAIPFVFIFGKNFPQNYISVLVGAIITILVFFLSLKIRKDKNLAVWSALLTGFGTIIWFLSSVGSTWYLGQLVACMFLIGALLESLGAKRLWVVGILVGAAYLARINTIVSLPIFIYLLGNKLKASKKNLLIFGVSLGSFILINFLYNYIRFGVIWDKGYLLIPGVSTEPWYQKGIINIAYIPNNLKVMLLSFPKIIKNIPFIEPSWAGLAIWITTPAFIFSLFSPIKEKITQFAWLAILAIGLTVLIHGESGYAQFGYRFAVDFYPFLIYLTIKGVHRMGGPKKIHWILLTLSILVNLWGVLWINKFGWVSF